MFGFKAHNFLFWLATVSFISNTGWIFGEADQLAAGVSTIIMILCTAWQDLAEKLDTITKYQKDI